ncbi:MAG: hypothetical protein E6Q73_14905 [Pseudorhodobacter sp.]|nr:MAG: hypothetical protein E6Q73_14905 [Pseudorhodobacter sp.]
MAENDDIVTEPQTESVSDPVVDKPEAAPRRRSGFLGAALGGACAAVAGFGLAQYVPEGWPLQDTTALEQALAAQTKIIAALEARLATIEGAKVPDISPLMDTLATLNGRVAALETGPAERAEDLGALKEALATVRAQLTAAPAAGQSAAPVPPNITALAAEAEARLKEAETRAAAMKAEAETMIRSVAAQAAFGRLQAAIDTGAPYATFLPELGIDVPDSLKLHADTGLPTLTALQASFPDAARLALEAALRADMGDSWTERATSFFRSQTGARSLTPREGNDPDAILSRAEAALAKGDLDQTLAELSALPEPALAPLAEWRATVEARRDGLKALGDIAGKIGG